MQKRERHIGTGSVSLARVSLARDSKPMRMIVASEDLDSPADDDRNCDSDWTLVACIKSRISLSLSLSLCARIYRYCAWEARLCRYSRRTMMHCHLLIHPPCCFRPIDYKRHTGRRLALKLLSDYTGWRLAVSFCKFDRSPYRLIALAPVRHVREACEYPLTLILTVVFMEWMGFLRFSKNVIELFEIFYFSVLVKCIFYLKEKLTTKCGE